ncbi:MAG: hypothetical protein QW507_00490 [Candidatus Nanoarchaeia archaeon]|nr:hypothetical protein [Candidatus Haiyanarchaeum thermophilum]MCW1303619.1 hypothetical protein [Candidatus Haiyanarchaeum thermophilum]MCW1306300.1 hypothetical protein [Candidatus Haiyanarchaeum thermophilum]MCW1307190.1 hypothetical protein [Candidatus Haiyanarchaeum thermophilum]MCW1308478.1 hypothetical protein [Candidatus Haiyanarchaeum thermophilum]
MNLPSSVTKGNVSLLELLILFLVGSALLLILTLKLNLQISAVARERVGLEYTGRLLLTMLKSRVTELNNLTLAEAISLYVCQLLEYSILNRSVSKIISKLNKPSYEFILYMQGDKEAVFYSARRSVCLEKIPIFSMKLHFPCNRSAQLFLGIYSKYEEVEKC